MAYLPRQEMRGPAARALRSVFDAPDRKAADLRLAEVVTSYRETVPRFATWAEENIPQGLSNFSLPPAFDTWVPTAHQEWVPTHRVSVACSLFVSLSIHGRPLTARRASGRLCRDGRQDLLQLLQISGLDQVVIESRLQRSQSV